MPRLSTTTEPARSGVPSDVHAESWEHALEAALAILRDIDARYERDRAEIEKLACSGEAKTRLLDELERRHRNDREPYVLGLADLHLRMMGVTLAQPLH